MEHFASSSREQGAGDVLGATVAAGRTASNSGRVIGEDLGDPPRTRLMPTSTRRWLGRAAGGRLDGRARTAAARSRNLDLVGFATPGALAGGYPGDARLC